jgi:iron complex outermembrane receptor protein
LELELSRLLVSTAVAVCLSLGTSSANAQDAPAKADAPTATQSPAPGQSGTSTSASTAPAADTPKTEGNADALPEVEVIQQTQETAEPEQVAKPKKKVTQSPSEEYYEPAPKPKKVKMPSTPVAPPASADPGQFDSETAAEDGLDAGASLSAIQGSSTAPGAVKGYVVKEGIAGTKTATPLQEVPQSISTVTRKQIEDRRPQTLNDSLAYVPGIRLSFDPRFDTFSIRGFDATYTGVYRDGLRQLSASFGQFRTEPYGLDSITILRGPIAALYGAGNAGGIVDMYTKRPTETPFHEVEYQMGSHNRFQGNFDFSGPVGENSKVLYRMTGVVRESEGQFMGFADDRLYLAPALTFKIDPNTKLTVFGEYMDATTGANTAWLNDFSDPDRTRRTNIWSGDPAFNDFEQKQERVGYEFEHKMSEGVILRQKARYEHLKENAEYIDIVEETAPNVFRREAGIVESDVHIGNMDNQAEFKFATGIAQHTLLAGVDATYITYTEGYGYWDQVPPLVNFNYGEQYIPAPPIDSIEKNKQFAIGAYLQDQLKVGRWVLTLGGRRDWVDTDFEASDGSITKGNDQAWSGRAGVSYLFDAGFAPYIAYGTSFVPNAGFDVEKGTPFVPTTAESKEVGFKYLVPGYNAALNGALFDIEQTGGVFYDPNADRSVQRGALRSRGFEIEGIASLGNGLSLQASYANIDMRIVDGVEGTIGKVVTFSPRHTASIWAYYTIEDGTFHGLGFGSGVRYVGTSYGNDRNTFRNDPRTVLDAAAHYDLSGFAPQFAGARLQFNVSNVFDNRDDYCESDYCYESQGRTILGSLRYRW